MMGFPVLVIETSCSPRRKTRAPLRALIELAVTRKQPVAGAAMQVCMAVR